MKHTGIKIVIIINYIIFAMLLNSVGILIQKSMNVYGVSPVAASTLELFKDMSIAFASFLLGSFLPRLGYKRGFILSLLVVMIGCLSMYYGNSFANVQILFAVTGISFAVVKVSVYALIGQISPDKKSLNSFLSIVESVFMLGIALAYILFPLFYNEQNPDAWLQIYLLIAVLVLLSILVVYFTKFNITDKAVVASPLKDFTGMLRLMKRPIVLIFAISAFLYVMTEQGIMSWLPTFNERVLHLPEKISVNIALILALSIAAGRFFSGLLVNYVKWIFIVITGLVGAALIIVLILPQTNNLNLGPIQNLQDVPLIGYIFPLIGLFLAPIYPLMNSVVLGVTDRTLHSSMAGLLTFFSALGGTLGSRIVGYLFESIGGNQAFYFALIPLTLLVATLFMLYRRAVRAPQTN